ncbi:MAG: hypothetical protein EZS28_025236, partial [Streblomastix strix]
MPQSDLRQKIKEQPASMVIEEIERSDFRRCIRIGTQEQGHQTENISSQRTWERFKKKSAKQIIVGQKGFDNSYRRAFNQFGSAKRQKHTYLRSAVSLHRRIEVYWSRLIRNQRYQSVWIDTSAYYIKEKNMTNPVKVRSKDNQFALGSLESHIYSTTHRRDDKNRSRVCVSPYPSGQRTRGIKTLTEEKDTDVGKFKMVCTKWTVFESESFANSIGSLTFLKLQIKRGYLYLKKLNTINAQVVQVKGWNSAVYPNRQVLNEIFWKKAMIQKNWPMQTTLTSPQVVILGLRNLVSRDMQLQMASRQQNLSEAASILYAFRRSESLLREKQFRSLTFETDNSSAAYNINSGSAAIVLASGTCNEVRECVKKQRRAEVNRMDVKSKTSVDLMIFKELKVAISNFQAQQCRSGSTDSNTNSCRTAIGMLFRIQRFQEKQIKELAQKYLMMKQQCVTKKK